MIFAQVPFLVLAAFAAGPALAAASFAMMLLVFGEIPLNDVLVARVTGEGWRSRIYAVKYLLSLGVGAVAVPLIAILYEGRGGFTALFLIMAALAAVVGATALLLPGRRRIGVRLA